MIERVAFPAAARIAEPGRRPVLAVRQPFGVDQLEHRALLEQEREVLVVVEQLHRVGRERTQPSERHAASRVVAVLHRVVVVPLLLAPGRERQRIRFALVAGAIRVGEGPGDIHRPGPGPVAAEVRLAVRKTRHRCLRVGDLHLLALRDGIHRCQGGAGNYECGHDQHHMGFHIGILFDTFETETLRDDSTGAVDGLDITDQQF